MSINCNLAALFALLIPVAAGASESSGAGAVVSRIESAARALHGFRCHVVNTRYYNSKDGRVPRKIEETLDVLFERPNLFVIDSKDSNEAQGYRAVSDGKSVYFSAPKFYSKEPIDKNASDFHWYHNDLLLLLVTGSFEKAMEFPVQPKKTVLPDETWNGKTYHVLNLALAGGYPIDYKVYIDDANVVHRILHTEADRGKPFVEDMVLLEFEENPSVPDRAFAFKPGPDQKPAGEAFPRPAETPLITVGRLAAPFSLPTPAGSRLALSEVLAGKKALLLNFWFVHCPPCRAEHPKLEKLYRDLKDQGFDILSVDDQDSPEAVAAYWKGARLTFHTVLSGPMAAINPKTGYPDYLGPKLRDYAQLVPYGVHACPTNVLLNSEGEVVYVSTGWDEVGLRKALEQLDIK